MKIALPLPVARTRSVGDGEMLELCADSLPSAGSYDYLITDMTSPTMTCWELGKGHVVGSTLVRCRVVESSVGRDRVDLPGGVKDVRLAPARKEAP